MAAINSCSFSNIKPANELENACSNKIMDSYLTSFLEPTYGHFCLVAEQLQKKKIAQADLHIRNGALNKYTIYRYLVAEHSNHYKNLIMMN